MGPHGLGGVYHVLVGGIVVTVSDVVRYVAGEQVRFLQHHAHLTHQGLPPDVPQVVAVNCDLALGYVGEAMYQGYQGTLAGARGTHQGHILAGADVQVDVLQYFDTFHVVEIDVFEPDFTPYRRHLNGVFLVIDFRLEVHQFEYTDAGGH